MPQGAIDYAKLAEQARASAPPTTDYAALAEQARTGRAAATPAVAPPARTKREILDAAIKEDAEAQAAKEARLKAATNWWSDNGPHAVNLGLQDLAHGDVSKGLHRVVTGAGITAAPMLFPAVADAFAAAPIATTTSVAATTAGGAAASTVAKAGASALGASEDQAQLAGDVAGAAGAAGGAAVAKAGVPTLAKWSTNRRAVQLGKDYIQSTRDIQAALGVNAEDVHRARPFLETVHANGVPIVGKEDATAQFVTAANVAIKEIEQHVSGLVQQLPRATVSPAKNAILTRVMKMPGASSADVNAAREVVAQYGLDKPLSLAEAESLRIRLNAENRSVLEGSGVKQRTATLTNAAYVARQEAADQLRDGIYGALEQHGVEGVRDLRLSEGSILKLRDAADPLTRGLRSESTVARTGSTSLAARIAQRVAPVVGAGAGAGVAGVPGAAAGAEIGRDVVAGLGAKNMSKNELLERAFRQSFTSPPVMTVQGIRSATGAPNTMPLLPSHAAQPALYAGD